MGFTHFVSWFKSQFTPKSQSKMDIKAFNLSGWLLLILHSLLLLPWNFLLRRKFEVMHFLFEVEMNRARICGQCLVSSRCTLQSWCASTDVDDALWSETISQNEKLFYARVTWCKCPEFRVFQTIMACLRFLFLDVKNIPQKVSYLLEAR